MLEQIVSTRRCALHLILWKEKPDFCTYVLFVFCNVQLVRQLQGQEENPFGDETSTTPKKIFQLLNQVNFHWNKLDIFFFFFFLIKFFNCQMCIHFCFHFFYVICIQFSGCTDLMSICAVWVILLIYFCVFSKFPLYCFRLLRLCQLFQHLNCRYSYICNVLRYMELFGL